MRRPTGPRESCNARRRAGPGLTSERADRNAGHGPSVIRGLDRANAEWILQIDSDGQFVVAELALLWAARDRCDVVLGARVRRHDPPSSSAAHSRRPRGDMASGRPGDTGRQRAVPPRAPGSLGRPAGRSSIRRRSPRTSSSRSELSVRGWRVVEVPVTHLPRETGTCKSLRTLKLVRFSLRGLAVARRVPRAVSRAHGFGSDGGANKAEQTRRRATVARPLDLTVPFGCEGRTRVRAWVASWWREAAPFAALAVVGLSLRLVQLGEKPFHHDESLHAWFGWRLATGEGYAYDPVYHGPVQFYLVALVEPPVRRRRLRQPHPGRGCRQRRRLPALLSPPPARHGRDADRLGGDLPLAEFPLLLTLPARGHPRGDGDARSHRRAPSVLRRASPLASRGAARPARGQLRDEGDDLHRCRSWQACS